MSHRGTETDFELTTIERLETIAYKHIHGDDLERPLDEIVLRDRLRASLARRYPALPARSLDEAIRTFSQPEGADALRRNMAFHRDLTGGIDLKIEHPGGRVDHQHVYAVDWDNPERNEFLIVNQLSIHGKNDRRPDVVIYVNGLPLVVFELKNPYDKHPTVAGALNQIGHYRHDIPQLFEFNAITVVSDGITTLQGMWTSGFEWFSPWKSIDGVTVEANTTGSMKTLVEGLFPKSRLLAYIRDFIVFEVANERITKKGARYHQFFAARIAADKAEESVKPNGDKRIGVVWHTTGSGKSVSMVFLVGILRRRLGNPTFVIEVDRTDLDDQLHDHFVAARGLVGDVKQAGSVDDLRDMLRTEGGGVIFTTIEKFRLKKGVAGDGEIDHPVLSTRSNIIVIADEAHRSQYGFMRGYARYLADALPNARRIGFTGTPISFSGADTVEVFGDLIHTYDIKQSQEDRTTVPIYYAPRQVRLHLGRADIDAALREIAAGHDVGDLERRKSRWAALAAAAGAKDRVAEVARDLLEHFHDRNATLEGKALAVCMTRRNCVALYEALMSLPGCPKIKIVMTGNLTEDPPEWSAAGHITTKTQREAIKKRMVDSDDPLKVVIVCDMWLTGTDIPCLHTLYVDKAMKGHTIIQAISRVNRVFRDKPHGLIVDYIGIGDDLREATGKYTSGGGRGEPAPGVSEEAKPLFFEYLGTIRQMLPDGIDYGDWRHLGRIDLEDRYAKVYGHLTDTDERRDGFLQAELKVSQSFLLVRHLDDCRPRADEIIFYQRVRQQLQKATSGGAPKQELDKAVRDLIDENVESEGVVDIFKAAGIEKADISILDDQFLQTFKDRPLPNLRLKLLEKLIADEIQPVSDET
jgi:type I restriction enzyme R subunit